MRRHAFDALAAVTGVAAIVGGLVVAWFGVEEVDPVIGIAGAAAALGLAVIPWPRRGGDDLPGQDDLT